MVNFIQEAKYVDSKIIEKYELNTQHDLTYEQKSQFVGFVIKDDILVSLPKHYCDKGLPIISNNNEENKILNAKLIANVMIKYVTNSFERQTTFFGKKSEFQSNFPFSSFHKIYNYYTKSGIYKESTNIIAQFCNGKIDWKKTIKSSDKLITEDDIFFSNLYRKRTKYKYDFVSDLMVYAINYSISKLSFLFDYRPIEYDYISYLDDYDKNIIIKYLSIYKRKIFSDDKIILINSLIDFYKAINTGGNYHIKIYNFQNAWEKMVEVYLNNYFISADHEKILFSSIRNRNKLFKKESFIVDEDGKRIEPDHYLEEGQRKYIFDSKYYEEIRDINYKQLSYQFLLTNFYSNIDPNVSCESILFLPGENKTGTNYNIRKEFRGAHELITYEFYLNVYDVMRSYLL